MDEKLNEYKERHIRWQDMSLTQLGNVNNLFLTLGIGFLAFAFDEETVSLISCSKESIFNPKLVFHILTVLSLFFSIVYGVLTSISRLYDFRISRHIAITRQRFYNKCKNSPTALPDFSFPEPRFCQRRKTLCLVLFKPIDFIKKEDVKNILSDQQLKMSFNELRLITHVLGVTTWRLLKINLLLLVLSLLFYSISLFVSVHL